MRVEAAGGDDGLPFSTAPMTRSCQAHEALASHSLRLGEVEVGPSPKGAEELEQPKERLMAVRRAQACGVLAGLLAGGVAGVGSATSVDVVPLRILPTE